MLHLFSHRYAYQSSDPASAFDPTTIRPVISPAAQARRKVPTIEAPTNENTDSVSNTPVMEMKRSPKRPFVADEDDEQPRKFVRGESPLKGAAGRRLDQQKRQVNGAPPPPFNLHQPPPPPPLPRDIVFLLSIIPRADTYNATKFVPEKMVNLLRSINIPNQVPFGRTPQQGMAMPPLQPPAPPPMGQMPYPGTLPYQSSRTSN